MEIMDECEIYFVKHYNIPCLFLSILFSGGTRVSVTEPSRISVAAPGSLKPEIVHRLHPGSIKSHPGDIDNHIAAVAGKILI